jgi:hypothetical protein
MAKNLQAHLETRIMLLISTECVPCAGSTVLINAVLRAMRLYWLMMEVPRLVLRSVTEAGRKCVKCDYIFPIHCVFLC